MDLSIITVSYNTKELLGKCLHSVIGGQLPVTRGQLPVTGDQLSEPPITEIIIVDNGSSDGSVEMVRNLVTRGQLPVTGDQLSEPPITDNRPLITIKLIENKENIGFSKAVNQGMKEATGDLVLLLNSDTVIKKNALGELLQFEKKVGPTIIGARLVNPDGTVQSSVFHLPTIAGAMKEYWFGKKTEFSKYYPAGNDPIEVESVVGGAMLISKKVIEKIGLLDERYFMYFEDLDYCRRAKKAGFKVYYLPSAEIIHAHGASGKKLADEENQWKRLIPSSKTYHGTLKHFLINFILWTGQKLRIIKK